MNGRRRARSALRVARAVAVALVAGALFWLMLGVGLYVWWTR